MLCCDHIFLNSSLSSLICSFVSKSSFNRTASHLYTILSHWVHSTFPFSIHIRNSLNLSFTHNHSQYDYIHIATLLTPTYLTSTLLCYYISELAHIYKDTNPSKHSYFSFTYLETNIPIYFYTYITDSPSSFISALIKLHKTALSFIFFLLSPFSFSLRTCLILMNI